MPRPFGLYLHLPYCVHRCSYCDFFSMTGAGSKDFAAVVELLKREMTQSAAALRSEWSYDAPLKSIFLGGGTPSLLDPKEISALIALAKSEFGFCPDIEVTLEANPETVSADFLSDLAEAGQVNRISMGVQSFQQKYLEILERRVRPEKVVEVAQLLPVHGFTNFSLDLITGIPGQTEVEVIDDLERAGALQPKHLSVYQLTLKPGHPLFKDLPSERVVEEQFGMVSRHLCSQGLEHYEISNFAFPGFRCRHNLLYWQGGDFLGLGPSASSRFMRDGVAWHRKHPSDFKLYSERAKNLVWSHFEVSDQKQTVLESAFMELRVLEGVDLEQFLARYGYDFSKSAKFELFKRRGLIEEVDNFIRLTSHGRLLADSVTSELVDYNQFR